MTEFQKVKYKNAVRECVYSTIEKHYGPVDSKMLDEIPEKYTVNPTIVGEITTKSELVIGLAIVDYGQYMDFRVFFNGILADRETELHRDLHAGLLRIQSSIF